MILDGLAIYGKSLGEYLAWKDLRALGIRRGWKPPSPDDVADVDPLPAWIQQGWWVVSCPACAGTPGEELQAVWVGGPLLMFCTSCGNAGVGGKVRRVALPDERAEIEALLAVRPMRARSWLVGEPLTDLIAENVQHGWGEESG